MPGRYREVDVGLSCRELRTLLILRWGVAHALHERLVGTVCILGRTLEKDWVEYCGLAMNTHVPVGRY